MKSMVPRQFLFRFQFQCRPAPTPKKGKGAGLSKRHRLPFYGVMDDRPTFAEVRIGWRPEGLVGQWQVVGKTQPIVWRPDRPADSDSLSLWIDTRDSRAVHRASRHCQWLVLAAGDGRHDIDQQVVRLPINRALEAPPAVDLSLIELRREALDDDGELLARPAGPLQSYRVDFTLPKATLGGYDPETNRRLGIFARVRDAEFGDQLLAPGPEFPYEEDPSLWQTLELIDEA